MEYTPTARFTSPNTLKANHYRFVIDALPDVSFFVQNVNIPSIGIGTVPQGTPFTQIPQVGDHIDFGLFDVTYTVDAKFKTYFSLWAWMRGYGFPTTYEEIEHFKQSRLKNLPLLRPFRADIEKTNATVSILQPDTDRAVAEFRFYDLFPTALGQLTLTPTTPDSPDLTTQATFKYSNFDVFLLTTE